ncbi:MAG: flagellar hook-associated protein FlgL [Proteobacteria bacterium]|nr:flagellar hook-associated protein FlgL [Pseudomonadota bacterium]
MRVTQQTIQNTWVRNLQNRLGSMDQLNRQIGSGVRIENPADDPSGASRVVRIEEVVARNEQYLKNINEALSQHRATESALEQAYQNLTRAKGLAVEGANDASVPLDSSFAALADEVRGIRDGILQLALSKHQDKYLFTGTAGEVAPFPDGGGAYRGDSNRLRVNIGNGQSVAVNLPGDVAFRETEARSAVSLPDTVTLGSDLSFQASDGSTAPVTVTLPADRDGDGVADSYTRQELADALEAAFQGAGANLHARVNDDGTLSIALADTLAGGELTLTDLSGGLESTLGLSPGTKNVFGLLDDLAAALESQDAGAVSRLLGRLDRALDDLVTQRGLMGARSRNLEFARGRLEAHNLTNETLKSEIEGVDLPRAVVKLSAEEQAYQTALAAGARIFNVSILDFLR